MGAKDSNFKGKPPFCCNFDEISAKVGELPPLPLPPVSNTPVEYLRHEKMASNKDFPSWNMEHSLVTGIWFVKIGKAQGDCSWGVARKVRLGKIS